MKTNSGKGYFYAKGQKARIYHSWAVSANDIKLVIRVMTKNMSEQWAINAFKAGFHGGHLNHGYYSSL